MEPERVKITTDLVTVTLVSMNLIPTQGGLTAAPRTEATMRADEDAGSWFLRTLSVPDASGYKRVPEQVEVLFCPSMRTRWDGCRAQVVWRRGVHPSASKQAKQNVESSEEPDPAPNPKSRTRR